MRPAQASQPERSGSASSRYADVIVPRHLNRTFTYGIPAHLQPQIRVGSLVRVPLGSSTVQGVVVAVSSERPLFPSKARTVPIRVRDVVAVADEPAGATIPPDILELTRQVSDYYLAPWGQCLRLIMPAVPGSRRTSRMRRASADEGDAPSPSDRADSPPRQPAATFSAPLWWPRFQEVLAGNRHEVFLVEDAPDARWAALLEAADAAMAQGKTVLLIAPEIRRATALIALSRHRWRDRVGQFHSSLPLAVRAREWRRIQNGHVGIVVGTRSAIFAPLRAIGLIGVDDEEDASLKEEQEPHYHARHVALMRARQHQAVLLLGTAHPSVETWQLLGGQNTAKPAVSPKAAIQLVDVRHQPWKTLLSDPMIAGVRTALEARTGAVLFVNRKGFASALHCRDCGASLHCAHCSVSLTLYRRANRLACQYCGTSQPIPDTCPACRSARLEPVGSGTERLEEELRRLFPGARIGRLDRDTARTPDTAMHIRQGIAMQQLDVVIGTQMLLQGDPLPPVGFVGVPYADGGLHRPDFRSAERTYHMLRDAVGLARPDGQVVLQTALPDHHVMASLVHGDPARFYEQELAFRRALGYPPFAHVISLRVSGKVEATVRAAGERWATALKEHDKKAPGAATVLGPIPAAVARVRGRHRWQILVKSPDEESARRIVSATLTAMETGKESRGLKFDVDVDPVEIG